METSGTVLLRIWTFFLLMVIALSSADFCKDIVPPRNAKRVTGEQPVFHLWLVPHNGNLTTAGTTGYKVEVVSKNSLLPFRRFQIAITGDESCGSGSLSFSKGDYAVTRPEEFTCPTIVRMKTRGDVKKSSDAKESSFLIWTPPTCGCVHFRALVVENREVYHVDDANIYNGPLTTTVCVSADRQENRENHMKALCQASLRHSGHEVLSHKRFYAPRGLEEAVVDKKQLGAAIDARLAKISNCCLKPTGRTKCFDRLRFQRVDNFCADGFSDIAFTSFRQNHMRARERDCCFILGAHRYTCFAQGSQLPTNYNKTSLLDFSMDETDPLNDLAYLAQLQDADIVSLLTRLKFNATSMHSHNRVVVVVHNKVKHTSTENKNKGPTENGSRMNRWKSGSGLVRRRGHKGGNSARRRGRGRPSGNSAVRRGRGQQGGGYNKRRTGRVRWDTSRGTNRRNNNFGPWNGRRNNKRVGSAQRNSGARWQKVLTNHGNLDTYEMTDEGSHTSSYQAKRRRNGRRRPKRFQVSKRCCTHGSHFASQFAYSDELEVTGRCAVEATKLEEWEIKRTSSGRLADVCYVKFMACCKTVGRRGTRMTSSEIRTRVDRGRPVEDEHGEGLAPDQGGDLDNLDRQSEKNYQSMRDPGSVGDNGEGEDGPARFDKTDNGDADDNDVEFDVLNRRSDDASLRRDQPPPRSGGVRYASMHPDTATEEMEDFDDRDFVDGREDEEHEEEDEDDGEESNSGENEGREDKRIRLARPAPEKRADFAPHVILPALPHARGRQPTSATTNSVRPRNSQSGRGRRKGNASQWKRSSRKSAKKWKGGSSRSLRNSAKMRSRKSFRYDQYSAGRRHSGRRGGRRHRVENRGPKEAWDSREQQAMAYRQMPLLDSEEMVQAHMKKRQRQAHRRQLKIDALDKAESKRARTATEREVERAVRSETRILEAEMEKQVEAEMEVERAIQREAETEAELEAERETYIAVLKKAEQDLEEIQFEEQKEADPVEQYYKKSG